jgi:hypothetical protein
VVTIWPPHHDMVDVTIEGVTDPDGDPVTINIDQIKQDEPTDGTGDGHTWPDGAGIGTSTAQVRAERSAQGDGRVYTIYFTASDGKGGSCQGSVTVCVPKSIKGSCTNGGAIYDSTQCDTSFNWQSGDSVTTHWPSAGEPAYGKNYCLLDGILHLLLDDPPCMDWSGPLGGINKIVHFNWEEGSLAAPFLPPISLWEGPSRAVSRSLFHHNGLL